VFEEIGALLKVTRDSHRAPGSGRPPAG
jgi:hypothetical protein